MKRFILALGVGVTAFLVLFTQFAFANLEADPVDPYTDDEAISVELSGALNDLGNVDLEWSEYEGEDYLYYKVVHSAENAEPYYPMDDAFHVGTDAMGTTATHKESQVGMNYYRVCVITTNDTRGCSNVVSVEKAEGDVVADPDDPYTDDSAIVVELDGTLNDFGKAEFNWSAYEGDDFKWYKLVQSADNMDAVYPTDGYVWYTSDVSETSYTHADVKSGTNYYRICVITTDSRRGCSNAVKLIGVGEVVKDPVVDGSFSDTGGHWADTYIGKLANKNIVEGKEDGNFDPDASVTRAEAIKMIMYGFGKQGVECDSSIFPDLADEDWYCKVVTKAFVKGYVVGKDGHLNPNDSITRAEAVKLVLAIKGITPPESDASDLFPDISGDEWYADYVAKAKHMGLIDGKENGYFEPNAPITRAELSKVLYMAIM